MIVAFVVCAAALASISISILLLGLWWFKFKALGKKMKELGDIESPHQVPDMPRKFTCQEMMHLTGNFCNMLGQGGFGSVFEGTLTDGTKVAVKRLDGLGHIKESFFAKVKSIGSIHHDNLVTLLGFCTNDTHRLLVYEHMANGSLDRWIFRKDDEEFVLTWQQRKKIILDIAKGLNYLHLECDHHKIIHLDIKPQNILLDENFNAKVSDFGLSKLIDKEQTYVTTTMRGTPGYLAPEWLKGVITDKVDVYSFGVVVLEIVCGRKVFDISRDEEDQYLLTLLQKKNEENQLLDIVNMSGSDQDEERFALEAVDMLKLAAWCLQRDYTMRPSMAMAIQVLEGSLEVADNNLDYNFWRKPLKVDQINSAVQPTVFFPSILSGPR